MENKGRLRLAQFCVYFGQEGWEGMDMLECWGVGARLRDQGTVWVMHVDDVEDGRPDPYVEDYGIGSS